MPPTRRLKTTKIHITALDGLVNVNSLFTLALFLGLSWNTSNATTLTNNQSCSASSATVSDLVTFHVYSFSSFLFSSLVAVAMKQAIKAHDVTENDSVKKDGIGECNLSGTDSQLAHVNLLVLRVGTLVSGLGSVLGCGLLTVALVDLVQIKLGTIGCGRWSNIAAIGPLVTLVPSALIINILLILFAFSR